MYVFIKVPLRMVLWFLIVAMFLVPQSGQAAEGPASLWMTFTIEDGIQSGNILSILVAQDGALWFGTDIGAGRYDGSWKWLTAADGWPAGKVRAMTQTKDGALWFATSAGLVRRASDGQCCTIWASAQGLPADDMLSLTPAVGNNREGVWVGTTRGLAYVDNQGVKVEAGIPAVSIPALAMSSDAQLFISVSTQAAGAQSGGVWRRDQNAQWHMLDGGDVLQGDVYALQFTADGILWAGTANGLVRYENGAWAQFPLTESDAGLNVLAIVNDAQGGLWIGTDQGVFHDPDARPDGLSITHLRAQPGGLVNDYVRAMAIDRDNALWLGTIGGVNRYAGIIWQVVPNEAVNGQRINAVLTDHSARVWVATEGNGLALWDGQSWQRLSADDGLPDDRVVALFEDEDGRIWVATGTAVGYIAQMAPSWRFETLDVSGLVGFPVFAFAQDADGELWLAHASGAVRWTEAGGVKHVVELEGKRVNAIYQTQDGVLWFGTQADGLLRRVAGQWQALTGSGTARMNDVVVNGIGETADGTLWVGTYNDGLWKHRSGIWQRMDMNLASPKVLSLEADLTGLWVGTRQGLTRFDATTWQSYAGDVLPGAWVTALATDPDGAVWIGTTTGLVHYRPEQSRPWVRIDSINLQPLQNDNVTLGADLLQVVRVSGGDLATHARDLMYLTQLSGVDATPRVHTDAQITAYSAQSLASGTYVLRVTARDAAFNYSQPVAVNIVVPQLVRLPGGHMVRADVFYPLLALGLLAVAGIGTSSGLGLRARARERLLTAEATKRQREALERAFNPYISGEPIRRADMFFGRDELLRRIFNALHQNSIMIHGERRMGKTTLLYQLAEQLRQAEDPEWVFVPIYIDLEGTPEELFFHQLMDATWGALQGYLTDDTFDSRFLNVEPEDYNDRDFAADLRALLDRLRDVVEPRKFRVILLMDEMDVVSSYSTVVQQQLRRIFMSSLAIHLGAVVAGIHISKAWDRLESPWYNMFNEIALEPFPPDEARKLLSEPVRGVYEWEPEALDFVISQAEGRPHRLQQYALEAVNLMLAAARLRITLADVQAAREVVERSYGG